MTPCAALNSTTERNKKKTLLISICCNQFYYTLEVTKWLLLFCFGIFNNKLRRIECAKMCTNLHRVWKTDQLTFWSGVVLYTRYAKHNENKKKLKQNNDQSYHMHAILIVNHSKYHVYHINYWVSPVYFNRDTIAFLMKLIHKDLFVFSKTIKNWFFWNLTHKNLNDFILFFFILSSDHHFIRIGFQKKRKRTTN